ncbi:26S proteasome non-ATPase regulatory subunit 5 [Orussus abietinus]|uniref:26S proteasome non-ATPase regulatory subunit 5 n=1 Tax=Orussus abietinus TaxID=222816 RepID=UPI000626117B|nr:26S proteasome non-ATPase regulatory subunit 5 [Orussus abietinus]
MADFIRGRLNRLVETRDINAKKDILTKVKIKLETVHQREIQEVARNFDLLQLFCQLTSNDREVVERTCDVLNSFIGALDAGEVHQRYPAAFCRCITHSDSVVKTVVLKEMLRTVSDPSGVSQLLKDSEMLYTIAETIGEEDLEIAQLALEIIKKVGETPEGLKTLYSGQLLRVFGRLLAKNDTFSFRIYEFIIAVSMKSKEALEASAQSGLLYSLLLVLDNEDVLLQLNALELLTQLALTSDGLDYLESQNVLSKLSEKIVSANENPLSNLLIPGLMKFFGKVTRYKPNEILSKYPAVVTALFEVLNSEDVIILSDALDTLGHICSNVEGKYALESFGDCMPNAIKKISELIRDSPAELRICALNCLTLILDVKKPEQDNRILTVTKSWFDLLGEDPLDIIIPLCRQPFSDIRQASLEVLAVIASQTWGQECIAGYPGLTEFLLDRNTETYKECKEIKYGIIKSLSQAEPDIFDANTMQRFAQFISEGPFFVETDVSVTTEGAV